MVVADSDAARRHAGRREQCLDFPEGIRGRPRVGRVDRHIGDDRAGSFMEPGLRQPHHVGALRGGQAAARVTDENHDRAVGFLDRDRMTQPIVVGNARCRRDFVGMRAGAERDGETDKRSGDAESALAIGRVFWLSSFSSSSRLSR